MAKLECTHEEADTRMLSHAVRTSSNGFQTIVIRSTDTDVTVLAVVLWSCAGSLWKDHPYISALAPTKHHVHHILVFTVRQKLWGQVCNALLGLHSLTECNSTSAFKKCGKSLLLVLSC